MTRATAALPDKAPVRITWEQALPACAEPIMHMMVSLYVPSEGRYSDFDGNLRVVEQFTALGGRSVAAPEAVHIQQAMQKAVARPASAGRGTWESDIRIPASGKVYRLEKILVLKDAQWFGYEFSRLR